LLRPDFVINESNPFAPEIQQIAFAAKSGIVLKASFGAILK
jgi:hypothetical protein